MHVTFLSLGTWPIKLTISNLSCWLLWRKKKDLEPEDNLRFSHPFSLMDTCVCMCMCVCVWRSWLRIEKMKMSSKDQCRSWVEVSKISKGQRILLLIFKKKKTPLGNGYGLIESIRQPKGRAWSVGTLLQMSAHRACRHLWRAKRIRLQLFPPRSLNFSHVLY